MLVELAIHRLGFLQCGPEETAEELSLLVPEQGLQAVEGEKRIS